MYLLSRPPYLRWAVAGAVVVVGLISELTPEEPPEMVVAAVDIPAGTVLDESAVDRVPATTERLTPEIGSTTTRAIGRGEVITRGDLTDLATVIPDGWWGLRMDVPASVEPGQPVMAVVGPEHSGRPLIGLAVQPAVDDGYGSATTLVAFDAADAATVARAVADSTVTVLVSR